MLNNSVRLGHMVYAMYTNFTYDASGRWKFKGFDRLCENLCNRDFGSPIPAYYPNLIGTPYLIQKIPIDCIALLCSVAFIFAL